MQKQVFRAQKSKGRHIIYQKRPSERYMKPRPKPAGSETHIPGFLYHTFSLANK